MKLVKQFFVYKCKLSLALLYLADMFINKLKTKFNSLLYRMVLNTKRIHNSCLRNFPARGKQMLSKVLFVSKKTRWPRPFGHCAHKIVTVGNSKWENYHHFCAKLSHCFSICFMLIGGLCSLRSMAVLSGARLSGEAAKTHVNERRRFFKLLPPQSPRVFSALARLACGKYLASSEAVRYDH